MLAVSGEVEREFLSGAGTVLPPVDVTRLRETLDYARTLRSHDSAHPSLLAYLSHPVRVAHIAFQIWRPPSVEVATIGLLHNVYEVAGLAEPDIERHGYGQRVARGIRLMTIDRRFETDTAYLARFYENIWAFGSALALIRCVDKLDNLLATELVQDASVRNSYIDLAERFVAPVATRLCPEFGQYFLEVLATMRTRQFQPALRARYDRFVANTLEVGR